MHQPQGSAARARIALCPEGKQLLLPPAASPPWGELGLGWSLKATPGSLFARNLREIDFVAGVSQLEKLRQGDVHGRSSLPG